MNSRDMYKNAVFLKLLLFCLVLLTIRVVQTHHYSFVFLLWNLFLAWVPLYILSKYHQQKKAWRQVLVIMLTLLFLPNAPYIVTDLFHLSKHLIAPLWFDTLLILSFALLGIVLFLRCFEQLLLILKPIIKNEQLYFFAKILILLSNGYGIYLGRYLRFNSWDIVSDPVDLFTSLYHSLLDRNNYKETLAITFAFSVFLYLIFELYTGFKKSISGHELSE